MGRHSSDNQFPYYRSMVAWFLPWAIMAAIAIAAVWVAVDTLGRDDVPIAAVDPTPTPTPEPATSTVEVTPTVQPTVEPTRTKDPEPKKTDEPDEPPELITEGVTAQILNGTNTPEADDLMADRLSRLGFEVVSIEGASKTYVSTTVFWSFPSAEKAAKALAERFGWVAEPKPDNLSSTVDIHVVVGQDAA